MKISKEQMNEHRGRIIAAASHRFRESGFDGVSVADLMKEAGLTHGGFYNHFETKEDLMALAARHGFDELMSYWAGFMERSPSNPVQAVIEGYLSERHYEHPAEGCVVAALGTETSRQTEPVKKAMADGIERMLGILEAHMSGRMKRERRKKAIASFSQMVGAMVLARSNNNRRLAIEMLATSSEFLTKAMLKQ